MNYLNKVSIEKVESTIEYLAKTLEFGFSFNYFIRVTIDSFKGFNNYLSYREEFIIKLVINIILSII